MADLFDRYLKVEIKYEASLRQITMIPVEADFIGGDWTHFCAEK